MPTNFPTSVDNFTNPTANDSLNLPSHSTQHANANDAIEAVESYLLNGGQGLTLVKKQTVGTAVTSVTVTNAFSSTYENYRIIVTGGSSNFEDDLNFKLGSSTTAYHNALLYVTFGTTTPLAASSNPGSIFSWAGLAGVNGLFLMNDVFSPFATKYTRWSNPMGVGNTWGGTASGMHRVSASYTDFTISTSASMTGGTIYVYGYGIGQ